MRPHARIMPSMFAHQGHRGAAPHTPKSYAAPVLDSNRSCQLCQFPRIGARAIHLYDCNHDKEFDTLTELSMSAGDATPWRFFR